MTTISYCIPGEPIPQGSMQGFVYRDKVTGKHRALVVPDNKRTKPWKKEASKCAAVAMRQAGLREPFPANCPVRVIVKFVFNKPASTKASVVDKTTRPDIDKLLRALYDSLTGIVFVDDSQITGGGQDKLFGFPERTEVTLEIRDGSLF